MNETKNPVIVQIPQVREREPLANKKDSEDIRERQVEQLSWAGL